MAGLLNNIFPGRGKGGLLSKVIQSSKQKTGLDPGEGGSNQLDTRSLRRRPDNRNRSELGPVRSALSTGGRR